MARSVVVRVKEDKDRNRYYAQLEVKDFNYNVKPIMVDLSEVPVEQQQQLRESYESGYGRKNTGFILDK